VLSRFLSGWLLWVRWDVSQPKPPVTR
jgi:hypothetical protein